MRLNENRSWSAFGPREGAKWCEIAKDADRRYPLSAKGFGRICLPCRTPRFRLAVKVSNSGTNKPQVSRRSGPRVEVGWPRLGEDSHDQRGDLRVVRVFGIAELGLDERVGSHLARLPYHGLSLIWAGCRLP